VLHNIINKIDKKEQLLPGELEFILELEDRADINALFKKAYKIKEEHIGRKSYFRGIIEFSNICAKDCYYCGIRKSNKNVDRYMMDEAEIMEGAIWAYENNYGSIVLQSGEREDEKFVSFIESILKQIKEKTNDKLGITLSLGEQTKETYQRWYNAGAHRYLLRIESTNEKIYKSLHPQDHNFGRRYQCLKNLRETGYQVGTGVMIGLPGQTTADLANDIIFFKENDIDMIGMGPYIEHKDTPMAGCFENFDAIKGNQYLLGLKMIAATRIYLEDVNIAATTALQALNPFGREMGIKAGANIIMPNITSTQYRESYQLYDNKPCIDEDSSLCKDCLSNRIGGVEEIIGFNEWGDSPHFKKRQQQKN